MRYPLGTENICKHRPQRRWLAALVIVCCTTASAAAQTSAPKSAHPFKSSTRPTQVRLEPSEPVPPSPTTPAPQSANPPPAGSTSGAFKSARFPSAVSPETNVDHAQRPRVRVSGGGSSVADEVSPQNAEAAVAAVPQETIESVPPVSERRSPADALENALRLPGPAPARKQIAGEQSTQASPANSGENAPGPSGEEADVGEGEYCLTLTALEAMALSANPSLGRASAAVAAARGAAIQAGLPLNPMVGYEGQQIGSGGLAEQHGLLMSQEFLRHEKRTLSREVAAREVQMAEYRFMAQRARVLTDVRVAYYRTLRAQRQIDMNLALLQISEQALRAAQALAEAKEIARTDVLQAQIEVDVAKNSLSNARNLHQSAWSQLTAVTGQGQLEVVPLPGDLFAPARELQFDEVLAWLRGRSPEIAVAAANVERARLYWERQRVEPHPNLSVQSLYNFVDNGIGGKPDAALAVSVPVPLYNRNQGAIQQARYQVVVAERSLAQLELGLQQRLAPVYERYANAKSAVQQYAERILPAAAEVLRLTQKTFEVGEIGFTNLLIVQRSYRQQQMVFLEAAEALRVAESEIDGLLLSGSLIEPPPQ